MRNMVIAAGTASALVAAQRQESLLRSFFSWKPLAVVGTFSYSLYLLHAPLLQLFWQYLLQSSSLSDNSRFAVLAFVAGRIILAAAYLFFRCFEEPFLQSSKRQAAPRETPLLQHTA